MQEYNSADALEECQSAASAKGAEHHVTFTM
jgi:hypothetical protein